MTFSAHITKIAEWLKLNGVSVAFDDPLLDRPMGTSGNYNDDLRKPSIRVYEPSAKRALLILAHEAGHWVGQQRRDRSANETGAERQAFVYGWKVLRLFDAPITRDEWIDHERGRRECVLALKYGAQAGFI